MPKFDKLTRRLLAFLSSKPAGTSFSISENWDSESDVSFGAVCAAVCAEAPEIQAAMAELVEQNLAKYRVLPSRSGPVAIAVLLRHRGLHWRELRSLERRERWKERAMGFVSGVLVTVLGGIIAELLLR